MNYIQAKNPKSKNYHLYTDYLASGSVVPFVTVFSRLMRLDDMLNRGWTMDEIYHTPANTKLIHNENSGKKGQNCEKLLERREKSKKIVSRNVAYGRYYRGRSIEDSISIPLGTINVYKKQTV